MGKGLRRVYSFSYELFQSAEPVPLPLSFFGPCEGSLWQLGYLLKRLMMQHFTVLSSRKPSSIAYNRHASFGPPDSLSFLQIPLSLGFVRWPYVLWGTQMKGWHADAPHLLASGRDPHRWSAAGSLVPDGSLFYFGKEKSPSLAFATEKAVFSWN